MLVGPASRARMLQQERAGTSEFTGKGVICVSMGKRQPAWATASQQKEARLVQLAATERECWQDILRGGQRGATKRQAQRESALKGLRNRHRRPDHSPMKALRMRLAPAWHCLVSGNSEHPHAPFPGMMTVWLSRPKLILQTTQFMPNTSFPSGRLEFRYVPRRGTYVPAPVQTVGAWCPVSSLSQLLAGELSMSWVTPLARIFRSSPPVSPT